MSMVPCWIAALALTLAASDQALIAAGQQPVPGQPVTIEERARGAERVVVATVTDVSSRYERNEFGDELIVSRATLALEEVLKGYHRACHSRVRRGHRRWNHAARLEPSRARTWRARDLFHDPWQAW